METDLSHQLVCRGIGFDDPIDNLREIGRVLEFETDSAIDIEVINCRPVEYERYHTMSGR